MRRIHYAGSGTEVVIANALTATTDVTAGDTFGVVPAGWGTSDGGVVPEFELVSWAAGTVTLTNVELFAGIPRIAAITGQNFTSVANATDTITLTAHGLLTGDGPCQITTTGAVPAGLAVLTDYWVIRTGANTFKLATSLANALAGTAIDLTTDGSGTNTITGTASTAARMRWVSLGVVSTSMAHTVRTGFMSRFKHHPFAVAYGLKATFGAAVAATFYMVPIIER